MYKTWDGLVNNAFIENWLEFGFDKFKVTISSAVN